MALSSFCSDQMCSEGNICYVNCKWVYGSKFFPGFRVLQLFFLYGIVSLAYQILWMMNADPGYSNMGVGDEVVVDFVREGLGKSSVLEDYKHVEILKTRHGESDRERIQKGDDWDAASETIMRKNEAEEVATVIRLNATSKSDFEMPKDVVLKLFDSKVSGPKLKNDTLAGTTSFFHDKKRSPISVTQTNSLLSQSRVVSDLKKGHVISVRESELLAAKLNIQNGPQFKRSAGLHPAVFRNISIFLRSYNLMERKLKIYVYKEGNKPLFHQPNTRGIYSSEGWFMKLLENSNLFTVRNPKKAHLFYLPFSSQMLKIAKVKQKLDVQAFLNDYIALISNKYDYWNRTNGADHFFVGCHEQAYKFTMHPPIGNCIKVLCNANVAAGFVIGKDSSLPSTYIRSMADLHMSAGGKPAEERSILAFFSGGLHGQVRRQLVHYWENKEPDMKIYGPLHRGPEGRLTYRELMKSSKYCICPRGYAVFSPRVVESIWYECVPVIIADNYVPPFFETLNWESFSVFVLEDDIPNLRSILLAIPEEKYIEMQGRVKMVQQHFFWQKKPIKYDLFHMILHSIWHNRLFQISMDAGS